MTSVVVELWRHAVSPGGVMEVDKQVATIVIPEGAVGEYAFADTTVKASVLPGSTPIRVEHHDKLTVKCDDCGKEYKLVDPDEHMEYQE